MRYIRIFLLYCQATLQERAKCFVWFLMSLFNPLVLLLFWRGASFTTHTNWNLSTITSYYFLLVIASALLMSHIEDGVARLDIQEGNLVTYLLRPFSYLSINFISELPFRMLQGLMGIIVLFVFVFFYGNFFTFSSSPGIIFLSILIAIFAYMLSFLFKMILGIIAFWVIDIGGMFNLSEMVIFIFSGSVLPLHLLPNALAQISYLLPFGYIIYFPIVAFQGQLGILLLLRVILMQFLWIGILFWLYRHLWNKGIRKFTGVGQ